MINSSSGILTLPAYSRIAIIYHEVVSTVSVTSWAMCFFCMLSRYCFSSKKIFSVSYWLKMIWVDAFSISTNVVKDKSIWYSSNMGFIGESVSIKFCFIRKFISNTVNSVASSFTYSAFPYPTITSYFNMLHEKLFVVIIKFFSEVFFHMDNIDTTSGVPCKK